MHSKVEAYFAKKSEYNPILERLRDLFLKCGLVETYKWSLPVYTADGKNIAGLGRTKNYAAIWFFQGNLLDDKEGVLVNAQEGKTKAMRHWRFTDVSELDDELISKYLREAVTKSKQAVESTKSTRPLLVPDRLSNALQADQKLADAFDSMGLTRQREFCEYISEAKRSETKENRLHKVIQMLQAGKGLNDKYRK